MTTGPPSPAARALLDQADVAGREGARILTALAGQLDATITDGAPDGPVTELLRGFVRRYLTGGIDFCPHLTGSAEPAWWLPARPGRLRCLTCARTATDASPRRPRERCDHCRRVRNPLQIGVLLIPPVVLEGLPAAPVAVGPVAVIYQFCPECRPTDLGSP